MRVGGTWASSESEITIEPDEDDNEDGEVRIARKPDGRRGSTWDPASAVPKWPGAEFELTVRPA